MLLRKRLNHVLPGLLLLFARTPCPEHEKALATNLATNITDGIGSLAKYLHSVSEPFEGLQVASLQLNED